MQPIKKMSRTRWAVAGFGVAALTLTGSMAASAATGGHGASLIPRGLPLSGSAGTVVTAGSTWTFYQMSGGFENSCVVISPGASKKFTDDAGDTGTWKSSKTSTTFRFTNGVDAGIAFTDAWVSGDAYWDGNNTYQRHEYGPEILAEGNDPLSWGSC
jgi:hypothetical protein